MDKQQFMTLAEHAYDTHELKAENVLMFKLLQLEFAYDDVKKTCTVTCPITLPMLNPSGIVHGGIYTYIADSAMGQLNFRHKDAPYVSLELKTSYFNAVSAGSLTATARYVKDGYKVVFMECDVKNEKDELMCTTTGTFYRFSKK